MNFVNCRHLLAVFVYCGTVLPVIVSGQPTTDSNAIVDPRDEIVSNLIDRITKLEGYLVSSVDEISKLKGSVCWTSVITFFDLSPHVLSCQICSCRLCSKTPF